VSEHITHLGVCDDTMRLAGSHPHVHPAFLDVVQSHMDIVRVGAVTRGADKWTVEMIVWARKHLGLPPEERDPQIRAKLAFVLGALSHRAADRMMKPIIRCWKDVEGASAREATIYQDICTFRQVYGGGSGDYPGPFTRQLLQEPLDEGEAQLEAYFRVIWRRALIGMHTISPDNENFNEWLTRLLDFMQDFPISLRQYARVAAEWHPAKVKQYLQDKNFYQVDDRLIHLARRAQYGSRVTSDEIVAAVEQTDRGSSRYARALAKALHYLIAASELFDERIDEATARERLEIGVPELAEGDEPPAAQDDGPQ
jgi:hypothetical protein